MENVNPFDVLEDRIRKATEVVRVLRKENAELRAEVEQLKPKLARAEKQLGEADQHRKASAEEHKRVEELAAELASLKKDRDEVKKRIARLVDLLESLEG
jgi:predicted RNase H-like nuclease (RuvC/YqgF family)